MRDELNRGIIKMEEKEEHTAAGVSPNLLLHAPPTDGEGALSLFVNQNVSVTPNAVLKELHNKLRLV
jgi:hypothetical protein